MWNKIELILVLSVSFMTALCALEHDSPIPPQPGDKRAKDFSKYLIHVRPTLPASVTNDDPLTPYTEKIKPTRGAIAEWFFIHIRFPVYSAGKSGAWPDWRGRL